MQAASRTIVRYGSVRIKRCCNKRPNCSLVNAARRTARLLTRTPALAAICLFFSRHIACPPFSSYRLSCYAKHPMSESEPLFCRVASRNFATECLIKDVTKPVPDLFPYLAFGLKRSAVCRRRRQTASTGGSTIMTRYLGVRRRLVFGCSFHRLTSARLLAATPSRAAATYEAVSDFATLIRLSNAVGGCIVPGSAPGTR